MKIEEMLKIINNVAEEIVTESELITLLQSKKNINIYDGFEPSGMAHIGSGILRAINIEKLQKIGVNFNILIADWHAWINNKLDSDLENIQNSGKYLIEVWKAFGVKDVNIHWSSDFVKNPDYWKKVIQIGKITSMKRAERAISIMGRKKGEMKEISQLFYPIMQVADIFELDIDLTQLGLDQRRACILAREVAEKMNWKKPVMANHHMLMGLEGVKVAEGYDENQIIDEEVSSKMSKSKPNNAIFVHDTEIEISKKISKAFCPEKIVKNNPILEYNKYIIFNKIKEVKIERDNKFGGDIFYKYYNEMENDFISGKLHPIDLKNSTSINISKIIEPIRKHFENNTKAKEIYDIQKKSKITR